MSVHNKLYTSYNIVIWVLYVVMINVTNDLGVAVEYFTAIEHTTIVIVSCNSTYQSCQIQYCITNLSIVIVHKMIINDCNSA